MPLVVFTGGARSGKSAAAQELARARGLDGAEVVVVVFGEAEGDAEMLERIARHRAERPDHFSVIEAADALSWRERVPEDALLVLDCLGTLLSRLMADELGAAVRTGPADTNGGAGDPPAGYAARVEEKLGDVVGWLDARRGDTIVVTNEVGEGVVPAFASGRLFRDALGRANRMLVARADRAYLCVAGRLVELTSLPRTARWPED